MKNILRLLSLSALCLLLQAEACTDDKEKKPADVNPPVAELAPKGKTYSVDPEKDFVIKTENGTVVTIPAGSLVGPTGETLPGPVEVNFTEYITTADIILSGISMKYDSAGQTFDFASGGMFNFTARNAAGQDAAIRPDRPVNVSMVMESDEAFSEYYLDAEKGNWTYLGNNPPVPNPDYRPLKKPTPVQEVNQEKMVFDWKTDTKKFPELAPFSGLMWQFAGDSAQNDPENKANSWVFDENWSNADLEAAENPGTYLIKLSSANKEFETTVRPVLSGSRAAQATEVFERQMEIFKAAQAERKDDILQRRYTKKLVRDFQVRTPGTHNLDVVIIPGRQLAVKMEIDFGSEIAPEKVDIFLLPLRQNSVAAFPYPKGKWQTETIIYADQGCAILAILPGQEVAVLDRNAYRALDFEAAETSGKIKIKMNNVGKITSRADLNDILEGL